MEYPGTAVPSVLNKPKLVAPPKKENSGNNTPQDVPQVTSFTAQLLSSAICVAFIVEALNFIVAGAVHGDDDGP